MGTCIIFNNFGLTSQPEISGSKATGDLSLARQSSVYSLTFDELNTLDSDKKEFGSMNMDELLENIWTVEGTQPMASASGFGEGIAVPSGNLYKQGSLTLPRTLSQKTVDEVSRRLLKGSDNLRDGNENRNGGTTLLQKEATFGEMTLEEYLLRSGVVGEGNQIERPNDSGFYGEVWQGNSTNAAGLPFEFPQPVRNHELQRNDFIGNNNAVRNMSSGLCLTGPGIISQQQMQKQQQQQQQKQHQQQQQQPLYPKQATLAFASPLNVGNNAQLTRPGTRSPILGRNDPSVNNPVVESHVIQSGGMGMTSLAPRVPPITAGSSKNQSTSNMIGGSNVHTSSVSASSYACSEAAHERKLGGTLEKVVERRHRRMIKNRESAARSRARKQAYTLELEAEIAKLREDNEDMQKKKEEFMEVQKCRIVEMRMPRRTKRVCLRRTLTGPW